MRFSCLLVVLLCLACAVQSFQGGEHGQPTQQQFLESIGGVSGPRGASAFIFRPLQHEEHILCHEVTVSFAVVDATEAITAYVVVDGSVVANYDITQPEQEFSLTHNTCADASTQRVLEIRLSPDYRVSASVTFDVLHSTWCCADGDQPRLSLLSPSWNAEVDPFQPFDIEYAVTGSTESFKNGPYTLVYYIRGYENHRETFSEPIHRRIRIAEGFMCFRFYTFRIKLVDSQGKDTKMDFTVPFRVTHPAIGGDIIHNDRRLRVLEDVKWESDFTILWSQFYPNWNRGAAHVLDTTEDCAVFPSVLDMNVDHADQVHSNRMPQEAWHTREHCEQAGPLTYGLNVTAFIGNWGSAISDLNGHVFKDERVTLASELFQGTIMKFPPPVQEVKHVRKLLSLGALAKSGFCHWTEMVLMRIVTVLEALPSLLHDPTIALHFPWDPEQDPFAVEILRRLNIDTSRVLSDWFVSADEVFIVGYSRQHFHEFPREDFQRLRRVIVPAFSLTFAPEPSTILWIRKENPWREPENFQALFEHATATLQGSGFNIVIMENLAKIPLQQQMQQFANARVVITTHGGALMNLIWANPRVSVVELFPPKANHIMYSNFWHLSHSLGLKYWMYPVQAGQTRYFLDPQRLSALLIRAIEG